MTQDEAEAGKYQVPLEVYERLAKATPGEKTDIVLRLIEEHPEGKLELPERDELGEDLPDLRGVDLSRDTLKARIAQSKLGSPPWWDANFQGVNLEGANLQGANLMGANLNGANLQDALLWDANLRGAKLWLANLHGAILWGANLQDASLWRTNLLETELWGAKLQRVNLTNATITHIHIRGAWLDRTRLRQEQLGGVIGEELDGKYGEAKHGYLALKQNFDDLGDYDAASWAYRKERRMEKLEALQKARAALAERKWRATIANCAKFASDQLVEWLCDYGESVPRVLGSLLVVYVLFTLFYALTWSVMRVYDTPAALIREPTRNLVDLARFSLGAMTTLDLTGLEPRNGLVELVAGVQALLGIALTGLLGFVVANRIRRS